MRIWLTAARPRTLPAAVAPVLVGTAAVLAVSDSVPRPLGFVAAMLASILIALGVLMLMQPFFLGLFTYSFVVTLVGTVMFIIVSHFPE